MMNNTKKNTLSNCVYDEDSKNCIEHTAADIKAGHIQSTEQTEKRLLRLRRGFGSVRFLGKGRKNAYAVHPPAKKNAEGKYMRPKAICYVPDWYTGFVVLAIWHADAYTPGLEIRIAEKIHGGGTAMSGQTHQTATDVLREYCLRIQAYACGQTTDLKNRADTIGSKTVIPGESSKNIGKYEDSTDKNRINQISDLTLVEVYQKFYDFKYGARAPKKLSISSAAHTKSNWKRLAPLQNRRPDDISIDELQDLINSIKQCRTVVLQTMTLIKQLYQYAVSRGYCSQNPALYLKTPDLQEYRHHQDFTDEELHILWAHSNDPVVKMVLIMCYSGYRLSAYETVEINLAEQYFAGGIKTKAGRGRIVPIHSGIADFVAELAHSEMPYLCARRKDGFCRKMKQKMQELEIDVNDRHHTPHSCRHTFSRLCESFDVREADRKRLLGHSFGQDITNGTYGHRTLEELRSEIEKIQIKRI